MKPRSSNQQTMKGMRQNLALIKTICFYLSQATEINDTNESTQVRMHLYNFISQIRAIVDQRWNLVKAVASIWHHHRPVIAFVHPVSKGI